MLTCQTRALKDGRCLVVLLCAGCANVSLKRCRAQGPTILMQAGLLQLAQACLAALKLAAAGSQHGTWAPEFRGRIVFRPRKIISSYFLLKLGVHRTFCTRTIHPVLARPISYLLVSAHCLPPDSGAQHGTAAPACKTPCPCVQSPFRDQVPSPFRDQVLVPVTELPELLEQLLHVFLHMLLKVEFEQL